MTRKGGGRLSNGLSPAEDRVARLAVTGMTNVEVAEMLHLSVHTVRQHMWSAFQVFNVQNREALTDAYKRAE